MRQVKKRMAIKLLKVGNSFNTPRKYYVSDSLNELENIANFGDLVLVPESSSGIAKVYVRGSGYWTEYSEGNGGGSAGASSVTKEEVFAMVETYLQDEEKTQPFEERIAQKIVKEIGQDALSKSRIVVEMQPGLSVGTLVFGTILE